MRRALLFMVLILLIYACPARAGESGCLGEHKTVDVNGISLYYEVAGTGKPVIMVHANGGDHTNFVTEIRQLAAAGYRVYALDSRGQGENAPLEEYHYSDMVEDTYRFITCLGLRGAAYYGWSDGGIIGRMLEICHPHTLSVLAVSGANLSPEGANPEDETVRWYAGMAASDPLIQLMFREPDIDPGALSNIDIPVLVTAGEDDLILRSHTQLIADSLPNARLVIAAGEDHSSYIYQSEVMGALLLEFLEDNGY